MSSEEIDCLKFPFIHLYVPALTPGIHCNEAALQFAENRIIMGLYSVNKGIVG
jgi:hypothetical protein